MRDATRDLARGLAVLEMEYATHLDALPHTAAGSSGITYADSVFPMFVFLAGMGQPSSRRALTTVGLGMAYNTIKTADWSWFQSTKPWRLRPFGVLQRIGAAGLLASVSAAPNTARGLIYPAAATALWILLSIGPIGERKLPPFRHPERSAQTRIDRKLIGWLGDRFYMYRDSYDPEGLLGALMTSVSLWFGAWVQANHLALDESLLTAISLMSFGYLFGYTFPRTCPVSKPFWTLSFALSTSGFSLLKYTVLSCAQPYLPQAVAYGISCLGQKSLEVFFASAVLDRLGFVDRVQKLVQKPVSRLSKPVVQAIAATAQSVVLAGLAVLFVQNSVSLRF